MEIQISAPTNQNMQNREEKEQNQLRCRS